MRRNKTMGKKQDEIMEDDYEQFDDEVENEDEDIQEEIEETKKDKKPKELTPFEKTIQAYLDDYASRDSVFNERYQNKEKNIVDCCNYICNQVKKTGRQGFADDEIYKMARDYYVDEIDKSDLAKVGGTVVVNHTIELSEAEKEKARKDALEEYKAQEIRRLEAKRKTEEERIKKEQEKAAEKLKKEQEKKAQAIAEAKENGGAEQMSIFDML